MTVSTHEEQRAHALTPLDIRALAAFVAAVCMLPLILLSVYALPRFLSVIALAAEAVVMAFLFRRAARISITVGAEGVEVANFWRLYSLAWPSIERINLDDGGLLGGEVARAVTFHLRGGRKIPAQASVVAGRRRDAVVEAIRPFAASWGIAVETD